MADNILRLKVESSEYDAKLKKAAEGIRHLAEVAHKGEGELTGLEKAELDFIKALGEMETKSRTAAGQVRELENTYKELKVVYDQLNDVEKADEGGKALAASLEQLKQRAQEAKVQLDNASKSLQQNEDAAKQDSSILDALAQKFTINIDALKLFDVGLKAVGGALNVAKDAFFASEANVDEWGRTVEASKSLYQGFLTALNTGDISGYLSRIDDIVSAARTAYNELDRLGTMKTIQAPKMSAQQTENERIRMMIQTGRYISPVDGRKNTVFNGREMQNGDKLTAGQIRALEKQLQNGMQKVVTLVGNEVKQTGKAIDAVYNRQAKELGLSLKEFQKGTSSMAEFDKRMAGYDQYQKWRSEHTTIDQGTGREIVERGNPYEQYAKWGAFRVDGDRYNDLVRLIQQRDQQSGQAYGMQSQIYRTMNRAEGFTVSKLMKGDTGSGKDKTQKQNQTEIQENQKKINELTQQFVDIQSGAAKAGKPLTEEQEKQTAEIQKQIELLKGRNELLGMWAEMAEGKLTKNDVLSNTPSTLISQKDIKEKTTDVSIPAGGLQLDDKAMKAVQKNIDKQKKDVGKIGDEWSGVASAIGAVGNAMAGIEDPAAKILGIVAQAIATVALGFAQATAKDSKLGVFGWIAAIAAGTATMISTISAIHSATGYANGGMIKGNSYSGDNLMAQGPSGELIGLNAGEIVLNRAQTANVASALQGNGMEGLNLTATIRGEQIRLALNNNGRRTGRGEYVQSRNIR